MFYISIRLKTVLFSLLGTHHLNLIDSFCMTRERVKNKTQSFGSTAKILCLHSEIVSGEENSLDHLQLGICSTLEVN